MDLPVWLNGIQTGRRNDNLQYKNKTMQNEWNDISVNPKKEGVYLVWHKAGIGGDVKIMRFNHEGNWRSFSDYGNKNDVISHWMCLPNDPNKKYSFEQISRPIIKWLCENYHPHVTVIITPTNAELVEGIQSTGRIMDYVKD